MERRKISKEEESFIIKQRIHRSSVFQKVFGGSDGEFVLTEIDKSVDFNGSTFDPDPYIHAYKAGQRSMAVFIHTILDEDIKTVKKQLEQEKKNE